MLPAKYAYKLPNCLLACFLLPFFLSSLLPALNETEDKQPAFVKQLQNDRTATCKWYCCMLCFKIPEAAHFLKRVHFVLCCTDICYSNSTGADHSVFQQTPKMARGCRAWRKSKSCIALLLYSFSSLLANLRTIRHTSEGAELLLVSM